MSALARATLAMGRQVEVAEVVLFSVRSYLIPSWGAPRDISVDQVAFLGSLEGFLRDLACLSGRQGSVGQPRRASGWRGGGRAQMGAARNGRRSH